MFGNQNSFTNATSPFANSSQQNLTSPFPNPTNNSSNSPFPSTNSQNGQPQQQNGGFFSGNQSNPTNATFGNTNNAFGTANNGGAFGNTNSFQSQSGGAGGSVWTSSNTTNATGIFGGTNTNTNSSSTGLFGNQQQQGNGSPTFSLASNNNPTNGGNNSQQKPFQANTFGSSSNSPFGNQQPAQNGLGLNSNFGNNTFGQGGQPQNKFQSSSPFGSSNNSPFGFNNGGQPNTQNNDANKAGTGWGIGGQFQQQGQPQQGQQQQGQKFIPMKSRNQKIDQKHTVKCILNLEQNTGMSLNQLRINFMNGTGKGSNNSSFSNPSFGYINQQPSSSPFTLSANTNNQNKGLNSTTPSFTSMPNGANGTTGTTNTSSPFKATNTNTFGLGNTNSSPFGGNSNTSNAGTNGTNPQMGSASSTTGQGTSIFGGGSGLGSLGLGGNGQNKSSGLTSGNTFTSGKNTLSFGSTPQNNQNTQASQNNQANQGSAFNFSNLGSQTQNLAGKGTPSTNQTQNNQTSSIFGGATQQPQQLQPTQQGQMNGGMASVLSNTPSLFGGQVQPQFPMMYGLSTIPNVDQQIMQAIVNIGFYSPEFREKFVTEKTPFDKLVEEPYAGFEEERKRNKSTIHHIDPQSFSNRVNKHYNKHDYKFKNPYDFGDHECFNDVNYDVEKGTYKKSASYRKKDNLKKYEWEEIKKMYSTKTNTKILPDELTRQKEENLPIIGEYQITPSLQELKKKKHNELKKVPNVTIENQFGKVTFKDPINLYRKDLSKSIEILPNSIDIMDREWEKKRCELTFRNFGNFTEQGKEKHEKFFRKMKNWMDKHQMTEIDFDWKTGDLMVQL